MCLQRLSLYLSVTLRNCLGGLCPVIFGWECPGKGFPALRWDQGFLGVRVSLLAKEEGIPEPIPFLITPGGFSCVGILPGPSRVGSVRNGIPTWISPEFSRNDDAGGPGRCLRLRSRGRDDAHSEMVAGAQARAPVEPSPTRRQRSWFSPCEFCGAGKGPTSGRRLCLRDGRHGVSPVWFLWW